MHIAHLICLTSRPESQLYVNDPLYLLWMKFSVLRSSIPLWSAIEFQPVLWLPFLPEFQLRLGDLMMLTRLGRSCPPQIGLSWILHLEIWWRYRSIWNGFQGNMAQVGSPGSGAQPWPRHTTEPSCPTEVLTLPMDTAPEQLPIPTSCPQCHLMHFRELRP